MKKQLEESLKKEAEAERKAEEMKRKLEVERNKEEKADANKI